MTDVQCQKNDHAMTRAIWLEGVVQIWCWTIRKSCYVIILLFAGTLLVSGAEQRKNSAAPAKEVELRGRVVCLAEEMHRQHQAPLPTKHEHLWGFRAHDGTYYTLLRSKFSEAIFLDERLREKELMLRAKLFPQSHVLEVTAIRSLRNGVVQDLYYYCDICAIQQVSPEPCACCQGPMELIEKPLSDQGE